MSLQVYVIFHDKLFKENYEMLNPDELDKIIFVCTNPNVEKTYDKDFFDDSKFIYEWKLPQYDPKLQMRYICDETLEPKSHFHETGVHWHIALNKLCKKDYIYICHNDMVFTEGSIDRIIRHLKPGRGLTIAHMDYQMLLETTSVPDSEEYIYAYILKKFKCPSFKSDKKYPMFTNCALETKKFEDVMHELITINKKYFIHVLPGGQFRPAIVFERTWALAVGSVLDEVLPFVGILHVKPPIHDIMELTQNGELTQYPDFNTGTILE